MRALGALLDRIAASRWFKPAVWVACLVPALLIAWRAYRQFVGGDDLALGVDPIRALEHLTGEDALALMLLAMSVTPVRRLLKWNRLQSVRRTLGVWSFAYALVHLSTYLVFDQLCYSFATCDYHSIWTDILRRPFIFMGMTAFSILLVLAITSTNGWIRRLKKNWGRLHRLVYVAAVAAIIHFIWIQKSDYHRPLEWAAWLGVLFAIRIYLTIAKRRALRAPRRVPQPAR